MLEYGVYHREIPIKYTVTKSSSLFYINKRGKGTIKNINKNGGQEYQNKLLSQRHYKNLKIHSLLKGSIDAWEILY